MAKKRLSKIRRRERRNRSRTKRKTRRKFGKRQRRARPRPKVPIWRRSSRRLTPRQRMLLEKSLRALSLVRREKLSLAEASKRVGLQPEIVISNTNAFCKKRGGWVAKKFDRIPRTMIIYEEGRKIPIEFVNSRTASLIGLYHNLVKEFLGTGKSSILLKLPRRRFKDIKGRIHILETDPRAILAIRAREPKPESFLIYRW